MICALINVALLLQLLGGEDMEDCSKWLMINSKDKITLAVFCLFGWFVFPTTHPPDIATVVCRGRG